MVIYLFLDKVIFNVVSILIDLFVVVIDFL